MRASTCAELRKRCASLADVSHLLMTRSGQNVAMERRNVRLCSLTTPQRSSHPMSSGQGQSRPSRRLYAPFWIERLVAVT
jgi:hypothetical protein